MSEEKFGEKEELERLKKQIQELREDAGKNFYRVLLKQWLIFIVVIFGIGLGGTFLFVLVAHSASIPLPQPLEYSKFVEIAPVVFNAIITIGGLFIGFVPLISFFFVREIGELERDYEQDWEEEGKKAKGNKLRLINTYYNLLLMVVHNIRSGVLRYTQAFVFGSIMVQMFLVMSYIITIGYDAASLGLFIDIALLDVIITGLFPILSIALYQPALKFVRYLIVEKAVTKIEFEK